MALELGDIEGAADGLVSIRRNATSPDGRERLQRFFAHDVSEEGFDYLLCNLILQGGGTLGLAHVGFLVGLEAAGVRFAGIAGTSAGAIVATAMVCARKRLSTSVGVRLLSVIAGMPMSTFIDGRRAVRELINQFLRKRNMLAPSTWPGWRAAVRAVQRLRGLNPGVQFEQWLDECFADLGVTTITDLRRRLAVIEAELRALGIEEGVEAENLLRVIATAMPVGLKGVFPRDLRLLQPRYESASPASFVRASMAVPGFFEPRYFDVAHEPWRRDLQWRLDGIAPPRQIEDFSQIDALGFVDGGLLSNLPVDAFEQMGRDAASRGRFPTIVVTLVHWDADKTYRHQRTIAGVLRDIARIFDAIRVQRDRDALRRLQDAGDRTTVIVPIDTGHHNWLNFNMGADDQADLFMRGLRTAEDFLRKPIQMRQVAMGT